MILLRVELEEYSRKNVNAMEDQIHLGDIIFLEDLISIVHFKNHPNL